MMQHGWPSLKNSKHFNKNTTPQKLKIWQQECDDPITKVGIWVRPQIKEYNKFMANKTSMMTEEKIELLNSIGFSWTTKPENDYEKWLHMYFKLYLFHYQNNSTSLSEADGHNSKIVKWVGDQKENFKNDNLSKLQIDLLNELDFDWTIPPPPNWDDMYEELVQYHNKFGSALVPSRINQVLATWTQKQRSDYLKGSLDAVKIQKLERIGFDWYATDDVDFHAMADRLANFKRKYNHTVVPIPYSDDPSLAKFVGNKRTIYGKNLSLVDEYDDDFLWSIANELESKKIPEETHFARMKRLIDLDFVWDPLEVQWMEMYQRLIDYKKVHNSTLVPRDDSQDQELGVWVGKQRSVFDIGELSEKRIALLNEIDFVWDPLDARWNEMFERLVEYKKKTGSTNVPYKYKEDPELANWVMTQRTYQERGEIIQRKD